MNAGVVLAFFAAISASNARLPKDKPPIMPWTVRTERGESRSGHGISFRHSKSVPKADKQAQEKRRLDHRTQRAAWSNDSRQSAADLVKLINSRYKTAA